MPYKHTNRIRTTLSEHRIERICHLIEHSHSARSACKHTGTPLSTFYEWKRCGKDAQQRREKGQRLTRAERMLADFVERMEKAEAEAIDKHLKVIMRAALRGNWYASAWWLERRHPEDWGRYRVDLSADPDGGADEVPTAEIVRQMILRTFTGERVNAGEGA